MKGPRKVVVLVNIRSTDVLRTEKFQDYLYGNTFLAVTDSNPLTYITSAKLDATNYR